MITADSSEVARIEVYALLVRVIAWWAEDPTRAEREEIIDVLMELAPGRVRKSEEEAQ